MARFLIVDDEPTHCRQIAIILRNMGHDAQNCDQGADALKIGKEFRPQVLVTDWRLSDDWTGAEVAEQLREFDPHLQVVVITGYSREDLANEPGIDQVMIVEKPFGIDEITAACDQALRSYHADRQP